MWTLCIGPKVYCLIIPLWVKNYYIWKFMELYFCLKTSVTGNSAEITSFPTPLLLKYLHNVLCFLFLDFQKKCLKLDLKDMLITEQLNL